MPLVLFRLLRSFSFSLPSPLPVFAFGATQATVFRTPKFFLPPFPPSFPLPVAISSSARSQYLPPSVRTTIFFRLLFRTLPVSDGYNCCFFFTSLSLKLSILRFTQP